MNYSFCMLFCLQQTQESWQVVFFISAGILMFGAVLYCVLGSGDIQPWAREHPREKLTKNTEIEDGTPA